MIREALSRIEATAIAQADLPDEARRLLPTITVEGADTFVTVAWHFGTPPSAGKPRTVWFPFLEARAPLDRESGVAIRPLDALSYDLVLESDEPIGTLADLANKPLDAFLAARERHLDLLDVLAASRALTAQSPFASELVAAGRELREVLGFISEQAFEPYYEVAHAQLRAWLTLIG